MVLKTSGSTWNIKGHTFPRRIFQKMVHNWIEINNLLLNHNFALIDAHLNNIALTGKSQPVWIDLGSIQPLKTMDQGIKEFLSSQLYPLLILGSQKDLDRTARLLVKNGGISGAEFRHLVGLNINYFFGVMADKFTIICHILQKLGLKQAVGRRYLLHMLKFFAEHANVSPPKTKWTGYRDYPLKDMDSVEFSQSITDTRPLKVLELINKLQPKTMMDIGANDGFFSILASHSCRKILAIDTDEGALDKFIQWILNTPVDVEAFGCVDDFHNVNHTAELVLGLALVHHLAISQQYKFDYIAKRFSDMSTGSLITEFMPNGIGIGEIKPDPLPDHYKLGLFIDELRKYFVSVEIIEYPRPNQYSPRILIFATGKI